MLTPYYSKPPHLYGLPKIHKDNIPLRPITSSRDAPTAELSRHLKDIIQPLVGKSNSFVKNSIHFVDILKTIDLGPTDIFVSFDVESLYTNVPLEESLDIIRAKLSQDQTLADRTELPLDGVMELLELCLRNSYFQVKDRFYAQIDGLPMGSSLSPVVANIYMEWFEHYAIETANIKPKTWLRYVDDTFIVWSGDHEELQEFLEHLNSLRPSINFTMEKEQNSALPFLDVLVKRQNGHIQTSVYRKPTHTGQYLHQQSNHSAATKEGIIRTLYNRAASICNSEELLQAEVDNLIRDLQQNGYSEKLIRDTITKYKNKTFSQTKDNQQNHTFMTLPYIKGISEKIRRIAKDYNIKVAFRSDKTLRSLLTKTKPENNLHKNCIYQIPCECGEVYIGETKRPLDIRVKEHKTHTERGETSRSGIAEHSWSKEHRVRWSEASVVHTESHWKKRKFKEAAFIQTNSNNFSKPSVDIPNLWRPLLNRDKSLKLRKSS